MSTIEKIVFEKANKIIEDLVNSPYCNPGLLGGDLGWCLLLKKFSKKNVDEDLYNLLSKQFEYFSVFQDTSALHIHKGLGGVYLTIHQLNCESILYRTELEQLHLKLYRSFEFFVKNFNYDFLYGASGLFLCFLKSKFELEKIITIYIEGLEEMLFQKGEFFIRSSKLNNVHFGFAHGLCGVSQLLVYALRFQVQEVRIRKILERIGNTLFDNVFISDKSISVPIVIDEDGKMLVDSSFGWCSGNLCFGLSLYNISKLTGIYKFKDIAEKLMNNAVDYVKGTFEYENNSQDHIHEFSTCHGLPSKSLLLGICYDKTKDFTFRDVQNKLNKKIETDFILNDLVFDSYKNNSSILYGTSGIFLSTYFSNDKEWQELLLLF